MWPPKIIHFRTKYSSETACGIDASLLYCVSSAHKSVVKVTCKNCLRMLQAIVAKAEK